MARQVNHPTIDHMVYFYIDLYYIRLERDPSIRQREAEHIIEINYADNLFKNCLQKTCNAKKFDYEENKDKFLKKIEVLTQVFAKREEKVKKSKARSELFQKFGN